MWKLNFATANPAPPRSGLQATPRHYSPVIRLNDDWQYTQSQEIILQGENVNMVGKAVHYVHRLLVRKTILNGDS